MSNEEVAHGLFGPGIFGTGIDLSALDEDTALKLGIFTGEQILAADRRGYARAISYLRDDDAWAEWLPAQDDAKLYEAENLLAAEYLESREDSAGQP